MGLKAFAAGKLRVGDTFTTRNIDTLAGKTVWEVNGQGGRVYLTLTDRTCVTLDSHLRVEVKR